MKKKILATMLCVAMTAGCLAGCGGSSDAGSESKSETAQTTAAATESAKADDGTASSGSSDEEVEFYMFISSPEYADSINELLAEYKKVKPNVTVNYETTQNDYPTMLKAKLNSGECPSLPQLVRRLKHIRNILMTCQVSLYRRHFYQPFRHPCRMQMEMAATVSIM